MPEKKKRPVGLRLVSPRGVAVYPKVNAADTKFKKTGEFATKVRYDEDDPAVKAFIKRLQPLHATAVEIAQERFEALPKASRMKLGKLTVNDLFTVVYDATTEEPTGQIEFKFSTPASGTIEKGKFAGKTWIKRPSIVDAKGKILVDGTDFAFLEKGETVASTVFAAKGPAIWGGSELKCSIEVGLQVGAEDPSEVGYFIPGTGACGLSLHLRGVQILKLVSGGSGGSGEMGFGEEEGYEGEDADSTGPQTEDKTEEEDGDEVGGSDF